MENSPKLTWSQIGHKLPLKIAETAKLENILKIRNFHLKKRKNERLPKNWFSEKLDNHIKVNKLMIKHLVFQSPSSHSIWFLST